MRKPYLLPLFSFILLSCDPSAHARACGGVFGRQDQIHRIQDVDDGEYVLCHKVSLYFFIAGVFLTDDGYVLQERKVANQYIPLDPEKIQELQQTGLLPAPLPDYSIPLGDYLLGLSLWIILTVIVVPAIITERWIRGKQVPVAEKTDVDVAWEVKILLRKALTLEKKGEWKQALSCFKELARRMDSPHNAELVHEHIQNLRARIANRNGS